MDLTTGASGGISDWLRPFQLIESLHHHAVHVLSALPDHVRSDLTTASPVMFWDYDPKPGVTLHVPVASPGRVGPSRTVVLKRTLGDRPTPFVRWLIAHELAHAFLRNGGRWPGDDPEVAADALADEWGFPRPAMAMWRA